MIEHWLASDKDWSGFMRIRLAVAVLFVAGPALWGYFILLTRGFSAQSIVEATLWFSPLMVFLAVAAMPLWTGLGLGALALPFALPLTILQRLECSMLLVGVLCVLVLIRGSIRQGAGGRVRATVSSVIMAICALIIIARFVYDRPGSANLRDTGGIGEAFTFVLGVLAYFAFTRVGLDSWDTHRNLRAIVIMVIIGESVAIVTSVYSVGWSLSILNVFARPMWFLAPLTLAWCLSRAQRATGFWPRFWVYGVGLAIVLLAILTPHRSRPLFAVGILLAVAHGYGYLPKITSLPLAVAMIALAVFLTLGEERFPLLVSRSLSTVLPVSEEVVQEQAKEFGSSGEKGWASPFRGELAKLAWREIRQHPLVGKGFSYSRDEIIWASSRSGAVEDAAKGLAVSGCYHNSILELAVFCGTPAAVLFFLGYMAGFLKFARLVPRIGDEHLKIISAGILGFFVATSGQMLMNGGGRDFFYICVLMGVMRGIEIRSQREATEDVERSQEGELENIPAVGPKVEAM